MARVSRWWFLAGGAVLGVVGATGATYALKDPGQEVDYCLYWLEGREPTIQRRSGPGLGSDGACSDCLMTIRMRVELGRDRFVELSGDGCSG